MKTLLVLLVASVCSAQVMMPISAEGNHAGGIPISFVNFSVNHTATGGTNSLVITAPASIVNNDLLIAGITSSTGTANSITGPTGWTACSSSPWGSTITNTMWVFYRVASSESGNYTFTAGSNAFFSGSIAHFSGTNASTPIDVCGVGQTGTGSTATALSVNASAATNYLLFFQGSNGTGTASIPSGFTTCGNVTPGSFEGYACGYIALAASGSTGNQTAGTATPWVAGLVSIKQ